jgi:hypothetical protein
MYLMLYELDRKGAQRRDLEYQASRMNRLQSSHTLENFRYEENRFHQSRFLEDYDLYREYILVSEQSKSSLGVLTYNHVLE